MALTGLLASIVTQKTFDFLRTEDGVDAFLDGVPGLAAAANLAQTVLERPNVRLDIKRALCLMELHCAHYESSKFVAALAPLNADQTRTYFHALHDATDAFAWGVSPHEEYLSAAERLLRTFTSLDEDEKHDVAKRVVESQRSGKLKGFDTDFIKRLVRRAVRAR